VDTDIWKWKEDCIKKVEQKVFLQIKKEQRFKRKGVGAGCSKVVECLPGMCKALGSIPSKKKRGKE
jgi:hypothetical protein